MASSPSSRKTLTTAGISLALLASVAGGFQGYSKLAVAARPTKPLTCGKNFACLLKAAATCNKAATLNRSQRQKNQDSTVTFTSKLSVSRVEEGWCYFELTFTGVDFSFSQKSIAYIKKEAKRTGLNPNAAVKEERERNTRNLRAEVVGKNMKCRLSPAELVPLLKQIRDGKETVPSPEELGCTGTMLEAQSQTLDLSKSNPAVGGGVNRECGEDRACFMEAVRTCTTAYYDQRNVASDSGGSNPLTRSTTSYEHHLTGMSNGKCGYQMKITYYNERMTDFYKLTRQAGGYTPEQDVEFERSLNDGRLIGRDITCGYSPEQLTESLNAWFSGSESPSIWQGCTGTIINPPELQPFTYPPAQ